MGCEEVKCEVNNKRRTPKEENEKAKSGGDIELNCTEVTLELPPLSEDGHVVPMRVAVTSPMTDADHVRAIHVFTEKNPQRADTQSVVAIAELSDTERGAAIPRDIIELFVCTYNGAEVFRAELAPAIAANPYIAFNTVATESGTLEFRWSGDNGYTHTEKATLKVVWGARASSSRSCPASPARRRAGAITAAGPATST